MGDVLIMIRILQVFGIMDCGGAETMIMEIYRNIDRTKIQFDFVVHTSKKGFFDDEICALGGRIFSVPKFSCKTIIQYRKQWKKLLSNHTEWKIIHGHVRSTASIFLSIGRKMGRYTIAHSHSISSGSGFSSFIKNYLQKRIKADYYLACSVPAGKWLFGDEIVNSENFSVLHNAIKASKYYYDEHERNEIRNELKCGHAFLVGHVGSFYDVKNHIFLLEVFKEIHKKNPDSKLILVGDGYLKAKIESRVQELHLADKVIFTGVRKDVDKLMMAMDVFVFPSKFEGLGMVVIEAQASGLSSVISDRVPNEVIITEELVTVQNLAEPPEQWANSVLSMNFNNRKSHIDEIITNGYDVSETTMWIEEFYSERYYLQ